MFSLGITGGIASGKTQFSRFLHEFVAGLLFDADACVRKNLEENPAVAAAIAHNFGKEFLNDKGQPNREKLRALVFEQDSKREYLESLLHPFVWESYEKALLPSPRNPSSILLADIPLIYETHSQKRFDAILVVACSPQIQIRRMTQIRQIPSALAMRMLHAQFPLTQKAASASYVVWNDGSLDALKTQARIFGEKLLSHND